VLLTYKLENTERAIGKGQSRETVNIGTKNAGRRQTKQNHNMVVCQIVNQTDDSGNVNIIYPSILQLAIIYLSYLKQRKYIDVFFNLCSHVILH
jgi:hypothetical protein